MYTSICPVRNGEILQGAVHLQNPSDLCDSWRQQVLMRCNPIFLFCLEHN